MNLSDLFPFLRASETQTGGRPEASRPFKDDEMSNMPENWFKNNAGLKCEILLVTPEMARYWRDHAHFERQRKIREDNVERLAYEMVEGRFIQGLQIYICVYPDGTEAIVNGNHTLEAIWASGVSQILTITRKRVQSVDEAGLIYAVFDLQKMRTWRDSIQAMGKTDIPMADKVSSAIGVIEDEWGSNTGVRSRPDRINKLDDYSESAALFANALLGAPSSNTKLLKRAGVMAVALETFRYQPSLAEEFWAHTAQDNGLVSGMPERALLQWLRNNGSGGHVGRRTNARAAALAWNAAWREEKRDYLKPNSMTGFYLHGTPWK